MVWWQGSPRYKRARSPACSDRGTGATSIVGIAGTSTQNLVEELIVQSLLVEAIEHAGPRAVPHPRPLRRRHGDGLPNGFRERLFVVAWHEPTERSIR